MSPLSAVGLLRASGADGVAGEEARADVTGATTGRAGRDYVLGAADWYGATPQPPVELTYASGHVFTGLIAGFPSMGGAFPLIRRNGLTPWTRLGTAQSTVQSVSWDDEAKTAALQVGVLGEYDPATVPTLSAFTYWFRDFVQPAVPSDSGSYQVVVKRTFSSPGTPSGSDDLVLQLQYDPDTADFNPLVQSPGWPIRIARRALPSWDTVYEWFAYADSGYTTPVGSSVVSDPDTTYAVWIRYRLRAEYNGGTPGPWIEYGEVTWSDPRPDV